MEIQNLPAVFSSFNFLSFLLISSAYIAVKKQNKSLHRKLMLGALASSAAFLCLYLIYHFNISEPRRFTGTGTIRGIYFFILITHTVLAVGILPLIGITVYNAARKQFERHKKFARLTLPLWMYVSITGIVIYFMLYIFDFSA